MAVAAIVLPATSYAATYFYVNTAGSISRVEASNATGALSLSAPNRAVHSGVALDTGYLAVGDPVTATVYGTGGATMYQYVDVNGNVRFVEADSPEMAIALAPNRAPHSGVIVASYDPIPTSIDVNL